MVSQSHRLSSLKGKEKDATTKKCYYIYIAPWWPKTQRCLEDRELNQARTSHGRHGWRHVVCDLRSISQVKRVKSMVEPYCTKIQCQCTNSSPQLHRWSVQLSRRFSSRQELSVDSIRRWRWWWYWRWSESRSPCQLWCRSEPVWTHHTTFPLSSSSFIIMMKTCCKYQARINVGIRH